MAVTPDTIWTLVQVYLQTLGLSLLFVGTGSFLYRTCLARDGAAEPLSLRWGRAYFLGLSVFLLLFVFLSRGWGSARIALWLCLAVMSGLSLWQGVALRSQARTWWRAWPLLLTLVFLVCAFTITNTTLWLSWNPHAASEPPRVWSHFGSIHSGRYANYGIFIAEHDRVPYLAQNVGQSILCAVHLLLGANCPLANLMVWLPFSLAFLALLLYGFFRSQQFPFGPCVAGTFLVLYCNVALSLVHVLLFDNGSPLAFIGYTDLIVGVATFLLLCLAIRDILVAPAETRWSSLVLPALLGVTWCWYAPHNIVVASGAGIGAVLGWWCWYRRQGLRPLRFLVPSAAVFAACIALGSTQLGTFLPQALREDVGSETFLINPKIRIRPYSLFATSTWTGTTWNWDLMNRPHPYEDTWKLVAPIGPDEIVRHITWIFETSLWSTLRIYCFPLLGLFLLWTTLRVPPTSTDDRGPNIWRAWWLLSLFAFVTGFAISFGLELGGLKWLLTRFLVPGTALGLICLACAMLRKLQSARIGMRVLLWSILLLIATLGPVWELAAIFNRNLLGWHIDPVGHRLNLMVQTKGPYVK